jgi:hypothetical protein
VGDADDIEPSRGTEEELQVAAYNPGEVARQISKYFKRHTAVS